MSFQIADAWVDVSFDTGRAEERLRRTFADRRQTIRVDADTGAADAALTRLASRMAGIDGQTLRVRVDLDHAAALAGLTAVDDLLSRVDGRTARARVDVDAAAAAAQLAALDQILARLDGRTANVRVDADVLDAITRLLAASAAVNNLNGRTANVNVDADVGAALAKIGLVAAAIGGLGALAVAAVGGIAGIGAVVGAGLAATVAGVAGVGDAVKALGEANDGTAESAKKLQEAMAGLSPTARAFAVEVRSLIDGPIAALRRAGQENLLPGLQRGLVAVEPALAQLTPVFGAFSRTLGTAFGDVLPILGRLAVPFFQFADAALKGLTPLGPVLDRFAVSFGAMVARVTDSGLLQQAMGAVVQIIEALIGYLPDLIEAGLQLMAVVGPPLAQAFTALLPAIVALAEAFAPIAAQLLLSLIPALEWLTRVMTEHPRVIGAVVLGMVALGGALAALSGLSGLVTVVGALAGAFGAVSLPVVAVVAGLGLLAAALVMAYRSSEPFRAAVADVGQHLMAAGQMIVATVMPALQSLWQTIQTQVVPALAEFGTAVGPIISWLVDKLAPVVAAVFTGIVQTIGNAMTILSGILKVATGLITGDWSKAWEGVKGIFSGIWQQITTILSVAFAVIRGIFTVEAGVLSAIWSGAWNLMRSAASAAWAAIRDTIASAWNAIVTWTSGQLAALRNSITAAWNAILAATVAAWNSLRANVTAAWNSLVAEVTGSLNNWRNYLSAAWAAIRAAAVNAWNGLWADVRNTSAAAWAWLQGNVFDRITSAVSGLAGVFGRSVTAIGAAWARLREAAAEPVRFVVNTVINRGIIETYNRIAGAFPGVPSIPSVPAFAGGGKVRGPGTGTSDSVPAVLPGGGPAALSRDEWIIRAGASRQLGDETMAIINNADRLGLQASGDSGTVVLKPRGFADGGKVGQVQSWLRGLTNTPYVWGGVGPNGWDCSGLTGSVYALLRDLAPFRRYWTTTSFLANPGAFGFKPGTGVYTVGVSPTHTVGNLAGLGFEAPHTGANIRVGSSARPTSAVGQQFYLSDFGGGSGGGGIIDWAKSLAKTAIDKLTGGWWQSLDGMGAMGRLGVGLGKKVLGAVFDDGGWLPPGVHTVRNNTTRPEPVFTGEQWATLQQLIPAQRTPSAAPDAGGTHHHYHFGEGAITVDVAKLRSVEELVGAIDALKSTARQYGGR